MLRKVRVEEASGSAEIAMLKELKAQISVRVQTRLRPSGSEFPSGCASIHRIRIRPTLPTSTRSGGRIEQGSGPSGSRSPPGT